jgi:hypothetical protein
MAEIDTMAVAEWFSSRMDDRGVELGASTSSRTS